MTVARARRTRKGTTSPVIYLPRKVRLGLAVGLLNYDLALPSALGTTAWQLLERALLSMDYRTGKLPYPLRWYARKIGTSDRAIYRAAPRLYALGLLERYPTPGTFPRNWRRYIPLWVRHFMHYDAAFDPGYVAALADLCRRIEADPLTGPRWSRRGGEWYQHLPNLRIHGWNSHATPILTTSDAGFRDLVPPPGVTPEAHSTRTLTTGYYRRTSGSLPPFAREPRAPKPPAPAERTTAPDPSPSTPSTGVLRFAPARGDGDGIPATNSPASGGRGEDQAALTEASADGEDAALLANLADIGHAALWLLAPSQAATLDTLRGLLRVIGTRLHRPGTWHAFTATVAALYGCDHATAQTIAHRLLLDLDWPRLGVHVPHPANHQPP